LPFEKEERDVKNSPGERGVGTYRKYLGESSVTK